MLYMKNNISPSLNWLIKQRARLAGKIEKLRNKLADVQPLIDAVASLEADLHSIDQSFKLHDIQIDIKLIKPIKPIYRHFKFPNGKVTVIVFNYFKTKSKGGPVSKDEIIDLVTENI